MPRERGRDHGRPQGNISIEKQGHTTLVKKESDGVRPGCDINGGPVHGPPVRRVDPYRFHLVKGFFISGAVPDIQIRRNVMDLKTLSVVFSAVFIAELGDKTQLATMLFATDRGVSKLTVFMGASLALIVASAIGVLAGSFVSNYISEKYLSIIAGIGFISIGIITVFRA